MRFIFFGRLDEALREFERLAKAKPDDRAPGMRLIVAYRKANRPVGRESVSRSPKEEFQGYGRAGSAGGDVAQAAIYQALADLSSLKSGRICPKSTT
jgi:hypothetical protein